MYAFNDAPLRLQQITAPTTTTNKLYNVGGTLYWAGAALGGASGGKFIYSASAAATGSETHVYMADFYPTNMGSVTSSYSNANILKKVNVYVNGQLMLTSSDFNGNINSSYDYVFPANDLHYLNFNFQLDTNDLVQVVIS